LHPDDQFVQHQITANGYLANSSPYEELLWVVYGDVEQQN
jgi:hypothetical protein